MGGGNGKTMFRGVGSRINVGVGILGASAGDFHGGPPAPNEGPTPLPCGVLSPCHGMSPLMHWQ